MNARGFTLVEWLIAMLIGVFLIGGGLSIFVASRATTIMKNLKYRDYVNTFHM